MVHNVWHDWKEILERENKGREFRQNIQEGAAFTVKRLQEMSQENNARGVMMRYVAGGAKNVGKGYQWLTEPLKYAAEEGDRIVPGIPTGQAFLGQLLLSAESLGQTLHERSGRGAEMWATGKELYNPFTKKRIGQLPDLGLDVPLAKGIAQVATGIVPEIFLEKGLGKGLKVLDNLSNFTPPKSPGLVPVLADGSTTVTRNVDEFVPSNVFQAESLGVGSAGRVKKGKILSPDEASSAYLKGGLYRNVKGRPPFTSLTNRHHVGGLDTQGSIAAAHKSFDTLKPGQKSPVVALAERRYKIRSGNYKENVVDILETNTALGRSSRVSQIVDQLDGAIHKDTVNDLLGTSGLKFNEITPQMAYFGQTKPLGKNPFPEIKILDPKTGDLIEIWVPKTVEEHARRFAIVREKLGIKKKIDFKKIKIDPRLDIYGVDHQDVHTLIKSFTKTPGNPLYTAQQAINSGRMHNMSLGEAAKVYADAHFFQERVAVNVLKYRYKKIEGLYKRLYKSGKLKKFGYNADNFNRLDAESKQRFFKRFVNEIAVEGGIEKRVGLKQAQQPITWSQGMTDVFGWQPTIKPIKPTTIMKEIMNLETWKSRYAPGKPWKTR